MLYGNLNSESGQMCAIKEVRVVSDDQTSKECLKQLNQVICLWYQFECINKPVKFTAFPWQFTW